MLENAQIVATRQVGRARQCRLDQHGLDDLQEWIDIYRRMVEQRLDGFGELVERTKGDTQ